MEKIPKTKRYKVEGYPGVRYIIGTEVGTRKKGKKRNPEKIYYIRYRKDGKLIEEKAGRQFQDNMTPAKASLIRAMKIKGHEPTKQEIREEAASRRTIGQLWEAYSEQFPDRKSVGTDKNRYDKHIEPALGSKTPQELSPLDIDRFRIQLSKQYSDVTVVNILSLLKRIINYGVNYHGLPELSFKFKMPRAKSERTETMTKDQLVNFIKVLNTTKYVQPAQMMKMALLTGMRKKEIFTLMWKDADFERGFITLRDTKSGKDVTIPMNEPTRQLLESIEKTDSPYVFPGKDDGPRKDAHKQMNKIKENAGLPDNFRPMHGLRHVYASMLASANVNIFTVSKLLTHSSPNMTIRYSHLSDEAMRNASKLAGKIITDAVKEGRKGKVIPMDQERKKK